MTWFSPAARLLHFQSWRNRACDGVRFSAIAPLGAQASPKIAPLHHPPRLIAEPPMCVFLYPCRATSRHREGRTGESDTVRGESPGFGLPASLPSTSHTMSALIQRTAVGRLLWSVFDWYPSSMSTSDRTLLKKLDRSILIFACLSFFCKFLDQSNIVRARTSLDPPCARR